VSHVERGHTRITLELAERLATALHCSIDDLLAPLEAPLPAAERATRAAATLGPSPRCWSSPSAKTQ
jgi:transcriptional regulator with XRE-family HTH domain